MLSCYINANLLLVIIDAIVVLSFATTIRDGNSLHILCLFTAILFTYIVRVLDSNRLVSLSLESYASADLLKSLKLIYLAFDFLLAFGCSLTNAFGQLHVVWFQRPHRSIICTFHLLSSCQVAFLVTRTIKMLLILSISWYVVT